MPLRRAGTVRNTESSGPRLSRPSIFFETFLRRWMDARVKPANDRVSVWYGPGSAAQRSAKRLRAAPRPGNGGLLSVLHPPEPHASAIGHPRRNIAAVDAGLALGHLLLRAAQ